VIKTHQHRNEEGLVAIIVATMIMIIMSLVVLGFARIMQREQRQATDKTLSTQAFYAAETGVNDTVTRLHDVIKNNTDGELADKTTCDTNAGNPTGLSGTIDSNLGSSYSCLLIDTSPKTLEYTQKSITTADSTIIPMKGANNETIARVEVSWEDESISSPAFRSCPATVFPPLGNPATGPKWGNSPGLMQVDLIPTEPISGSITRANLINGAMNVNLYPVDSSAPSAAPCGATNTVAYGSYTGTAAGATVAIRCSTAATPRDCVASITGLNTKSLYMRLRAVYNASSATIRMYDSSNNQLSIKGAQVVVDSTGKAADVIRRIQVRVPTKPKYDIPDDALKTSTDVCKLLNVIPNVSADTTCAY
jgi:Tfp pilus assembly protein PilX